jgi:N,N'-diacetyllegionaminate synthase
MKKIISIIPARGGSKRLKNKNILELGGKPLISHTIEESLKSILISRTFVSTDDLEIKNISKKFGAEVIDRPSHLSKDDSPSFDCVLHVLNHLKESENYVPNIVVLLQPTSPLRTSEDINSAIKILFSGNYDSVISVSESNPSWSFSFEHNKLKPILGWCKLNERKQDLPKYYSPNGAIFVIKPKILIEKKSFYLENSGIYLMPSSKSFDIDTKEDLDLVNYFLSKKNSKIKVSDTVEINYNSVFIIAEAGVNHNGSLELAKQLVDIAVDSGADAVKFQTYKTEELVTFNAKSADYQQKNINKNETQFEMLKKLELSEEDFLELKKYCDEKSILFLSTPHTESSVDFLNKIMPLFKIGSGDLNNLPLLEKIAKLNKPIIISTGMGSFNEISEAINLIKKYNKNLVVLHCTTNYPCSCDEVNLRYMLEIERTFNVLTGYSDHTEGIIVPTIAASLGAVVIEKHFTLNKDMSGPDHKASLNPEELKKMVFNIRNQTIVDIPKETLGIKNKILSDSEKKISEIARKSIVAKSNINPGSIITKNLLIIKRPGTGILPKDLNKVLDKKAKKFISKDSLLTWEDLE